MNADDRSTLLTVIEGWGEATRATIHGLYSDYDGPDWQERLGQLQDAEHEAYRALTAVVWGIENTTTSTELDSEADR